MKLRALEALEDRPRKTMACPALRKPQTESW